MWNVIETGALSKHLRDLSVLPWATMTDQGDNRLAVASNEGPRSTWSVDEDVDAGIVNGHHRVAPFTRASFSAVDGEHVLSGPGGEDL